MNYGEMYQAGGEARGRYQALARWLAELPAEQLLEKRRGADLLLHRVGIMFAVYGDDKGVEQLAPFESREREA